MKKVIDFVKEIITRNVIKDDVCIDMTIGNGNDTLFLSNISKFVYGFDIQEKAIESTNNLLTLHNKTNYKLILKSHEFVDEEINEKVKCVMYNLGYLPSFNKDITTLANSTIASLSKAIKMLDEKGLICLVIYSGHENGKIEAKEVEQFARNLNQKQYDVIKYDFINQINNPPYAIIIKRR